MKSMEDGRDFERQAPKFVEIGCHLEVEDFQFLGRSSFYQNFAQLNNAKRLELGFQISCVKDRKK